MSWRTEPLQCSYISHYVPASPPSPELCDGAKVTEEREKPIREIMEGVGVRGKAGGDAVKG